MKVLLYLWILAWGLDRAIFWATEAAWFGSVGQGAWFNTRFVAQFGLFWVTFALALISAALAMRIAARPAPGAELRALSGVLEPLEPLRRNATRLAWLVLIAGAWIGARQIAGGWDVVLAARAGDLSNPIYALPLARLIANFCGEWSLFLLGALTFAGILRALPLLAARQPTQPRRLWRALSALGLLVLLARAALYALSWAEACASDGTTGAELFIGLPLAILGIALCLLAAFWCVKRPGYQRLGLAVAGALLAPHLLRIVLSPLNLIVPTPASVEARNRANTRAAWSLDAAPVIGAQAPPLAAHWPIWNEEALLGLARGALGRNAQHVIDWKRATIAPREAILAGVPAGLENFGSPHDADAGNSIEWLTFDATRNVEGSAPISPNAALPLRSFYGVGGRPLLGDATADAGVPFAFWGWKIAWAWRLRDPLLMLEGARAKRLLVFRGALETAQKLAPFLTWGEAQLNSTPANSRWEMVGYASTPYARGALAADDGEFANQNSATPAVILRLDPRNGRAQFFAGAPQHAAIWTRVLNAQSSKFVALDTPMLDTARSLVARRLGQKNVLSEAVWTWSGGRAARVGYASNWPAGVGERLAALDGAARHDWASSEGAQLQMGDAVLWPDARAPGGFWVGRSYYASAATAGVASAGGIARDAKMWRVSLTGLADSPIASGDDARAALVDFDLKTTPVKSTEKPGQTPENSANASEKQLLLQALGAHDAAQKAATASNWGEWAKQSALERQLLQELAARRQ